MQSNKADKLKFVTPLFLGSVKQVKKSCPQKQAIFLLKPVNPFAELVRILCVMFLINHFIQSNF